MANKKQKNLPGIQTGIPEIEEVAIQLAAVRHKRIPLTAEEVRLSGELLPLMHKHKLTKYSVEGIDIEVIPAKEKVHVKVDKIDAESNGDGAGGDGSED